MLGKITVCKENKYHMIASSKNAANSSMEWEDPMDLQQNAVSPPGVTNSSYEY